MTFVRACDRSTPYVFKSAADHTPNVATLLSVMIKCYVWRLCFIIVFFFCARGNNDIYCCVSWALASAGTLSNNSLLLSLSAVCCVSRLAENSMGLEDPYDPSPNESQVVNQTNSPIASRRMANLFA